MNKCDSNHSSDAETEYEFTDYGRDGDQIIVSGGGLMNGNAYAVVYQIADDCIYREYGKLPTRVLYCNSHLEYDDEGYNFNIVTNFTV